MVFLGYKLAVALRAKGGSNLMIQTHGVPTRAVQDATAEVADTLDSFASGQAGLDGSGDKAPGFSVGQLRVAQGWLSVAYRLVGSVYAMVVSEPGANVFLCLQLLDAVAKVLVGCVRGVDVTPDKLAKRYTEARPLPRAAAYMLLDDLLCGGFSTLPPAFVHSSATDERLLAMPTSAADAARRFKKLVGRGQARSQFVPALGAGGDGGADPTPPPVPETPARAGKQLAKLEGDPLGTVHFDIPPDALPPPPPRAAGARLPPPPAAPRAAAAAAAAFAGAVEEDAAARPVESEGFGAFGEVRVLEAKKAAPVAAAAVAAEEGWAAFGEGAALEPMPMPAGPAPPAPAPPPPLSDKDVQDSLQLVEVWHAEVAGGRVACAGVEGSVVRKLAPYGLRAARFRLLPSGGELVDTCLRGAAMNRQFAERAAAGSAPGAGPSFLATFQQASIGCAYLKYSLPTVACAPPLQLALHVAPGAPAGGGAWQGLVVLRYAASPALPGSLLDLVVDLDLPPEAASLARVSPAAQWAKEHGRLRWSLARVPPGGQGTLRVVVAARPGAAPEATAASLARSTLARVRFSLRPGASLSGLGLQVSLPDEGAAMLRGNVQCYGECTVAP
eukprot:scaffold3.g6314.t1